MKFAKYDKDNFILKISKQEAKDLMIMIDFLVDDARADLGYNQAFRDFFNGLNNLSSDSN